MCREWRKVSEFERKEFWKCNSQIFNVIGCLRFDWVIFNSSANVNNANALNEIISSMVFVLFNWPKKNWCKKIGFWDHRIKSKVEYNFSISLLSFLFAFYELVMLLNYCFFQRIGWWPRTGRKKETGFDWISATYQLCISIFHFNFNFNFEFIFHEKICHRNKLTEYHSMGISEI